MFLRHAVQLEVKSARDSFLGLNWISMRCTRMKPAKLSGRDIILLTSCRKSHVTPRMMYAYSSCTKSLKRLLRCYKLLSELKRVKRKEEESIDI